MPRMQQHCFQHSRCVSALRSTDSTRSRRARRHRHSPFDDTAGEQAPEDAHRGFCTSLVVGCHLAHLCDCDCESVNGRNAILQQALHHYFHRNGLVYPHQAPNMVAPQITNNPEAPNTSMVDNRLPTPSRNDPSDYNF